MQINYFIGIDVSKLTLDVHLLNVDGKTLAYQCIKNEASAINKLLQEFEKSHQLIIAQTVFCMEYTGIYNAVLLQVLGKCNTHIWMESGLQIKRSMGITRGKNDKVDSLRIAQYGWRNRDKMKLWKAPRAVITKLSDMEAHRSLLVEQRKALKTAYKEKKSFRSSQSMQAISKASQKLIKEYDKQIENLEKAMLELIRNDENLSRLYDIILSVDGVGFVSAVNIIIKTNEFLSIDDPNKFACFSGVAPFSYDSGTSVKGRMRVSHMADKKLKSLLHLCALNAMRMKGELNDYAQRKIEEGKNKMLVLNNIRNKIIHRIFACVRNNRKYEKNYDYSLA